MRPAKERGGLGGHGQPRSALWVRPAVASSKVPGGGSAPPPEGPPGKAEPSRAKSRLLPNMPKLVIPSSATKFPPEITVTPPTPTLLSPKGSISEETKQKLKVMAGLGGPRVGDVGAVGTGPPLTPARPPGAVGHPVGAVGCHGAEGELVPAGAGGAGDVEPGVLAGERDGRGRGLHGHLRARPGPRPAPRTLQGLRPFL